jgi:transketolase
MPPSIYEIEKTAYEIRKEIVRMTHKAQSGHPGGSLSAIDVLTCLYMTVMKHDPKNPEWEERDRFVLSKGHASPALYGILAFMGYFPREELMTFRQLNSRLQGHPERLLLPGIEISTGSLGQGLSVANGIAMGLRLKGSKSRVYCVIGDGELQEGQIWEAIQSAGHRKLDNLCAVLDRNRLQIDGEVEKIKHEEPIVDKLTAFGWNALRINGHDYTQILSAFDAASETKGTPTFIVADTVKGKGVSFMENNVDFHGKAANDDECRKALEELDLHLDKMISGRA